MVDADGRAPSAGTLLVFLAVNVVLVVLGFEAFRRLEPSLAERV